MKYKIIKRGKRRKSLLKSTEISAHIPEIGEIKAQINAPEIKIPEKKTFKKLIKLLTDDVHFLLIKFFIRWALIAVPCGVFVGAVITFFRAAVIEANAFRADHRTLMLCLLPLAGLVIVFLYRKAGFDHDTGTNDMIYAAHEGIKTVKKHKAPIVFAATILTHICGGSAGVEGASLQVGGGVLEPVSVFLKFGKNDSATLMMCAISAAFASLLGAPIGSAVFAIEVSIIGSIQYAALIPCVFASLSSWGITKLLGLGRESFTLLEVPAEFEPRYIAAVIALGAVCAATAIVFCRSIEGCHIIWEKFFKNPYIRIAVAGVVIAGLILLLGTDIYSGAGYKAMDEMFLIKMPIYVFAVKIALTSMTLGAGFKGGEILPTFFIGAAVGSALSGVFGLSVSLGAAIGFTAVFCGVTNCPLASLILGAEMFGGTGIMYLGTAIFVSYLLSGYEGLYSAQVFYQKKMKLRRYGKEKFLRARKKSN
ncbi:MAG: chloride channel protein [Ruminococcus sp.]|nr:chloride channel protein [Ruminococcus sp.]